MGQGTAGPAGPLCLPGTITRINLIGYKYNISPLRFTWIWNKSVLLWDFTWLNSNKFVTFFWKEEIFLDIKYEILFRISILSILALRILKLIKVSDIFICLRL